MNNKEKKKSNKLLKSSISLIIGALLGVVIVWAIQLDNIKEMSFGKYMYIFFGIMLAVIVNMIVNIILHEAGHLVCGLISGYRFVSFRIGSISICKYPDGVQIKRFSIPGTAGQCLMAPPDYRDGKYPYKLYLAGGVVVNLLLTILFVILFFVIGGDSIYGRVMLVFAIVCLYTFLTNAIPMKVNGVANDGHDIINLDKNEQHKKEFWQGLDINAKTQMGARMSEVGVDFDAVNDEGLLEKVSSIAVQMQLMYKLNYLLDNKRFEEAYELCKKLVDAKGLLGIYKNETLCDKLFIEILAGDTENVEKTYTEELKKYIVLTHKFMIGRMRLMYAYNLLYKKDESEALKEKLLFEKGCGRYPNLGEVAYEKMLMEVIEEKTQEIIS